MASASLATVSGSSSPWFQLCAPSGSTVSSPPSRLPFRPSLKEEPKFGGLEPSRINRRPFACRSKTLQSLTAPCSLSTFEKLALLVSEFQALPEPIDRVKRLLYYATILPEFEESARIDSNRVMGCTAQVWLDVRFEDPSSVSCCRGGRQMSIRADSDSEITKGFCSCLIRVLDGARPEEVLEVRAEDLGPMNMGVVAHSRVNTWHNVFVGMQRRTKALLTSEGKHNGGEDDAL